MEEIKADPFVYAAIENACQRLDPTSVNAEDLTSSLDARLSESLHLVVNPLKNVLSKPETAQSILQELEVLRLYLHDFYTPLEVDWDSPLDTSNELLEQIRWFDISALAEAISRKDHALFSEYLVPAFTKHGQLARCILNMRWDRLRNSVERLMIAGIGLSSRIDDLAKSFHRRSNYYSLTAVIQGVKASGFRTETLSEFGELINPSNDYQYYRHGMLIDGVLQDNALHFLFPALSRFMQGDMILARVVMDDSAFYLVRADNQGCIMQSSPLDFVEAVKDNSGCERDGLHHSIHSDQGKNDSRQWLSTAAPGSLSHNCFPAIYLEKENQM